MSFLGNIFIWWKGPSWGTRFTTWKNGIKVGEDSQGNRYYESKDGIRRWVIYNGTNEGSRVPPEWHAWLHKTVKEPPTENPPVSRPWEKEHVPNLSGTAGAYVPPGSLKRGGPRPHATGDYEPWTPE